jgi:hypothetical protein
MRASSIVATALLASACTPILATTPHQFLETGQVRAAGEASVSVYGGAGMFPFIATGAGAGGRVRLGLGHGQELGVEGQVEGVLQSQGNGLLASSRDFSGAAWAAKAVWKSALTERVALLAGAGAGGGTTGQSWGGDLGIVGGGALSPAADVYVGLRANFVRSRGSDALASYTAGLTLAGGLCTHLGLRLDLCGEMGGSGAISDGDTGGRTAVAMPLYVAGGLTFTFR